MIWLSEKIEFPDYKTANKDGVIALGNPARVARKNEDKKVF